MLQITWKDQRAGLKAEATALTPVWTHSMHAGPVSCLQPAGGWLFSGSYDMSVVAWHEPQLLAQGVAQTHEDGNVSHEGKVFRLSTKPAEAHPIIDFIQQVTGVAATKDLIFSVDDNGVLLVRNSRESNEVGKASYVPPTSRSCWTGEVHRC